MVDGIQSYIGSLNWGYRVALRDKGVKYLNEVRLRWSSGKFIRKLVLLIN